MKKLYLFLTIISIVSCNENKKTSSFDEKIPSYDEKIYGNIREIHTTTINQSDSSKIKTLDDIGFYNMSIDSFDLSGNRVIKYNYWNKLDIYRESYQPKYKMELFSIENFKLDSLKGLIYSNSKDEKGKLTGYSTYFLKNNSIITSNYFNENKQLKFILTQKLNEKGLIYENTYFDKDSILITNTIIKFNEKGFIKSIIGKDSSNKILTINYKYLKFDNNGNWMKRIEEYEDKSFNEIKIRDIIYYNN
jgi:hypothetical protein